ncbi:hypothetical protein GALL_410700 [mine drainage metagenome]|uniref:RNA-directed DNA polymerase (Reverse transcriptase) n=1 Tax=mine drainage metagenome TaxID=410659 RepID=A0A1J5QMJ4_9ZZZZ
MALLRRLYGKLKLTVNEAKSAVGSAFGRKFLGYTLWHDRGEVRRAVAANSRCWRRNSGLLLNAVLNLAYFDRLELPRLS